MPTKVNITEVEKLEKVLVKTVKRIYELNMMGKIFIPMRGQVLVRVMPKEHLTPGGILLPETDQNKPVYEGIVITTWKSWDEIKYITTDNNDMIIKERLVINHASELQEGDRVAFPHFQGLPLGDFLSDKYYRLTREDCILGKIVYTGDELVRRKIIKLTSKMGSVTTSGLALGRSHSRQ